MTSFEDMESINFKRRLENQVRQKVKKFCVCMPGMCNIGRRIVN